MRQALAELRTSSTTIETLTGATVDPLCLKACGLVPPSREARANVVTVSPETSTERCLAAALQEAENEVEVYRQRTIELQAALVVNELYSAGLRKKLAFREEKAKGGGKRGKLLRNGKAKLLTGQKIMKMVEEHEEETQEKEKGKQNRADARDVHKAAMQEWERKEKERKNAVTEQRQTYKEKQAAYKIEKQAWAEMKKAGDVIGRFPGIAPKLGKLPTAIPKPKLRGNGKRVAEEGDEELSDDGDVSNDDTEEENTDFD